MAVGDLVLKIAEAMAVLPRLRAVIVLERLSQAVPVLSAPGALGPVGHDDVGVAMGLVTRSTVCVLDDFHQAVGMRVLAELMAVDVLVIVPVRHRPMLPAEVRCGQTAAGQ